MRIAIVVESSSESADVLADSDDYIDIAALAHALVARGHIVRVYERRIAPEPPDVTELVPGVALVNVPAGPPQPLSDDQVRPYIPEFGQRLCEDWTVWRPDVVHAYAWRTGLAALNGREQFDLPIVHGPHLSEIINGSHEGRPTDWARLELALSRSADAVVVHTEEQQECVVRAGVPRGRAAVIPVAVDLERFHPDGAELPRTGRTRLVATGPLMPHQGFANLVEALRYLPKTELLIGSGSPIDSTSAVSEADRLRSLAGRIGVDDRIKLFEPLPNQHRPDLLRSADIVVSATERQPFGLGLVEAMACSRAVVASDIGGHRDIVVHRGTGVLVSPGNIPELVAAVRTVLADRILLEGYGLAGRERAEKRYTWTRIAEAHEMVYDSLVREDD